MSAALQTEQDVFWTEHLSEREVRLRSNTGLTSMVASHSEDEDQYIHHMQLAIVAQFREVLRSRQLLRPGHDTRNDLCRYLKARQWDVSKALALWQGRMSWEASPQAAPPEVPFTDEELQLVQRFYPHFWHKTDKFGRPVWYELLGSLQLGELLKHVSMERLLKLHVLEMHKSVSQVYPACSQHAGREVYTCTTIICLKGIKLSNFTKDVRNFVYNVSMIDQNYHPERLGQLLVVNAPIMFKGLWSVISPWLEARTKRKIQVMSASSTPASLRALIPGENLIQQLGGNSPWDPHLTEGPWSDAQAQRGLEKICSSTSTATAVNDDSIS